MRIFIRSNIRILPIYNPHIRILPPAYPVYIVYEWSWGQTVQDMNGLGNEQEGITVQCMISLYRVRMI